MTSQVNCGTKAVRQGPNMALLAVRWRSECAAHTRGVSVHGPGNPDPLKIKEIGHFGNKSSVYYFSGWGASFIVNEKKVTEWFVD